MSEATLPEGFWSHPATMTLPSHVVGNYCRLLSWAAEHSDGSRIPGGRPGDDRPSVLAAISPPVTVGQMIRAHLLLPDGDDWLLVTDLDFAHRASTEALEEERRQRDLARVEAIYNGEPDPIVAEREQRRRENELYDEDLRAARDLLHEAREEKYDDPRVRHAVDRALRLLDDGLEEDV